MRLTKEQSVSIFTFKVWRNHATTSRSLGFKANALSLSYCDEKQFWRLQPRFFTSYILKATGVTRVFYAGVNELNSETTVQLLNVIQKNTKKQKVASDIIIMSI